MFLAISTKICGNCLHSGRKFHICDEQQVGRNLKSLQQFTASLTLANYRSKMLIVQEQPLTTQPHTSQSQPVNSQPPPPAPPIPFSFGASLKLSLDELKRFNTRSYPIVPTSNPSGWPVVKRISANVPVNFRAPLQSLNAELAKIL